MKTLREAARDYLALRRGIGIQVEEAPTLSGRVRLVS